MSNANMVTGVVVSTKRAGTSYYGNPSYDVTLMLTAIEGTPVVVSHDELRTVTLRTSSNAGIAYGIENREYRETPHTFALTRAGRISHEIL